MPSLLKRIAEALSLSRAHNGCSILQDSDRCCPSGVSTDGRLYRCRMGPIFGLVSTSRETLGRACSLDCRWCRSNCSWYLWVPLVRLGFCLYRTLFLSLLGGSKWNLRISATSDVL